MADEYIHLEPDVKEWNRNTVADGNWMNANTIVPLKQNIKQLIDADADISRTVSQLAQAISAMNSNYPSEPDKFIKSIKQTAGVVSAEYGEINTASQQDIKNIFV